MAHLLVRVADLVEAEGRTLRMAIRDEAETAYSSMKRLVGGTALLACTAVLFLGGAALLILALYLGLEAPLGKSAAAALTGVSAIILGGACLWSFNRITIYRRH